MNPDPQKKLQHRQKGESIEQEQSRQESAPHQFGSVDEMLRYDTAQTELPSSLKSRLQDSISKESTPERPGSWWRRLFGA